MTKPVRSRVHPSLRSSTSIQDIKLDTKARRESVWGRVSPTLKRVKSYVTHTLP